MKFYLRTQALLQTGDAALLKLLPWQEIATLRQQQASVRAYFDVFWLRAVVMSALVPVVLHMRRSVAEKGARIGGE